MEKKRTVRINEDLFICLYAYHMLGHRDAETVKAIETGLEERMERMLARRQYAEENGLLTK